MGCSSDTERGFAAYWETGSGDHGVGFQPLHHSRLQGGLMDEVVTVGAAGVGSGSGIQLLLGGLDALALGNGLIQQVLFGHHAVRSAQHGVGVGVALCLGDGVQIAAVVAGQLVVVIQEHAGVVAGHLAGQILKGGVVQQAVHDGILQILVIQRIGEVGAQRLHGVHVVAGADSSVSSGVTGSEMEFTVTRNTASLPLSSTVLPSESVEAS
jgi:hypothetical protein